MREAFSATSGANVGYEPRLFVPDTEHPPLAVLRNVSVGAAQRTSNVSHTELAVAKISKSGVRERGR
jgi:hypothetical protein